MPSTRSEQYEFGVEREHRGGVRFGKLTRAADRGTRNDHRYAHDHRTAINLVIDLDLASAIGADDIDTRT